MDRSSSDPIRLFDSQAAYYQAKYMDVGRYAASLDLFCSSIERTDADVLEIACGPGSITRYLLDKRPDLRILGTDAAPNMLELAKHHQGAMRSSLMQTVNDINDWIGHMYDLATHIDAFDDNDLVERDRKMVPQQIEKTRIRINQEKDPAVRSDLEDQLKQLEQQQSNLEATVNSVKRAEIQLESTLSSLGTIYAQMSLLGTKEVDSSRAQRLRLEIQDEVSSLQDTIEAMNDVQQQRLSLR